MKCYNCNKKISNEEKICPFCKVQIDMQRCPECWTKLGIEEKICSKCGCDIEKYRKEEEEKANYKEPTIKEKLASLPLWKKILPFAILVVVVFVVLSVAGYLSFTKSRNAKQIAGEFVEYTDAALEKMGKIAEAYENSVYGDDWLNHIENAQKLREKYKTEIAEMKETREPVAYFNSRVKEAGDEEISRLAKEVYRAYNACYSHVISENGKYPHYLSDYKKLVKKYEKAVGKLKKEID